MRTRTLRASEVCIPALLGWVSSSQRIKNSLVQKARRYGNLQLPYIIALNYLGSFAQTRDLVSALFGQLAYVVDMRREEPPRRHRMRDGFWYQGSSPAYDVSAVWMFNNANIYSFPSVRHSLILNPDALHPLVTELPTHCLAVDGSQLVRTYNKHTGHSRKL